jgi:hypothetical protein
MIKKSIKKSRLPNLGLKYLEAHQHFKNISIKMKQLREPALSTKMTKQEMKRVSRLRLTSLEVTKTNPIY